MADKQVEKTAPLPLSVEKMKKQARAALVDWLPGIRDVILWTLIHAGAATFSFAFSTACDMLIHTIFTDPPLWLLTDAEETVTAAAALVYGMLWCFPPLAAAAAVALMLPRHRRWLRLLLAYAALVGTTAGHGMLAGATHMFGAADQGAKGLFFRTVATAIFIVLLVKDVVFFVGLILRGGEE